MKKIIVLLACLLLLFSLVACGEDEEAASGTPSQNQNQSTTTPSGTDDKSSTPATSSAPDPNIIGSTKFTITPPAGYSLSEEDEGVWAIQPNSASGTASVIITAAEDPSITADFYLSEEGLAMLGAVSPSAAEPFTLEAKDGIKVQCIDLTANIGETAQKTALRLFYFTVGGKIYLGNIVAAPGSSVSVLKQFDSCLKSIDQV